MALLMSTMLLKHDFYDISMFSFNAKHVLSHVFQVFYSIQVAKEFLVLSLHELDPVEVPSYQRILSITIVVCK